MKTIKTHNGSRRACSASTVNGSRSLQAARVASKVFLSFVIASLCLTTMLYAAVPEKINYQGKLKESGALVTATKAILFKIYDASTAGNQLWQSGNPAGTAANVSVTSGLFTYVLGGANDETDLSGIDWENNTCYLEVKVEATILSPREQLISVPSALSVRGLDIDTNGNVGIGTTSPNAKLQVDGILTADNISDNLLYRSCLRHVSATSVKILAGTIIKIGSRIFNVASDTALTWSDIDTGAEEGGKDYHIFSYDNSGTLVFKIHKTTAYNDYIDTDTQDAGGLTYPAGYDSTNSIVLGGFHNNATDTSATAGDILQYSVWDRKNRPSCPDPRGMVKSKFKKVWYDIYLASAWNVGTPDSNPGSNPYNQPTYKVRSVYQATIWDTMTWYYTQARGHNSGKRLLMYDEFIDMATGTPEQVNITGSADPGTTGGHIATNSARIVSSIGAEDSAGVLWQWGRQLYMRDAEGAAWAWAANTGGYGSIYHYHTYDPVAPRFGGGWAMPRTRAHVACI